MVLFSCFAPCCPNVSRSLWRRSWMNLLQGKHIKVEEGSNQNGFVWNKIMLLKAFSSPSDDGHSLLGVAARPFLLCRTLVRSIWRWWTVLCPICQGVPQNKAVTVNPIISLQFYCTRLQNQWAGLYGSLAALSHRHFWACVLPKWRHVTMAHQHLGLKVSFLIIVNSCYGSQTTGGCCWHWATSRFSHRHFYFKQ